MFSSWFASIKHFGLETVRKAQKWIIAKAKPICTAAAGARIDIITTASTALSVGYAFWDGATNTSSIPPSTFASCNG